MHEDLVELPRCAVHRVYITKFPDHSDLISYLSGQQRQCAFDSLVDICCLKLGFIQPGETPQSGVFISCATPTTRPPSAAIFS